MLPLTPCLLTLVLLVSPAHLTPSATTKLQQTPKNEQDSIKLVISEGCATHGNVSGGVEKGQEIALAPGSPLILTHTIKLVPSGSGSCGCEKDFAALRERLERLEREVSDLREKCDGAGGSCCTSESKGAGCSIKPGTDECPNECSDQGRCEDGKCVCFPGYSGPDCSESSCPENCSDKGRCVNGRCECDPGFTGPDCSQTACPDNCSNKGRCVNGRCVCDSGFTGPSCADRSCPGNCNRRGRCVNGQCVCNPGFTGPDCSKKACPNECNNRGRCENGKCMCENGFTGADCSEMACPENCNNKGRCVNGKCVCNPGFTGPDCSKKACPNDCNNHGRCVNGRCVCDSGFAGADCSEMACPGNCNNRGRCINGQCVCNAGFTGPDCSKKACPSECNNRGRCVNGKCMCDNGFTGADCSEMACPGNCNNRGQCVNGQCICEDGFTGEDCLERTCPNDCSDQGRCVNGRCECNSGFTGEDCSQNSCPDNCNNRGQCVDGQCVCRGGFVGQDCSELACPDNCSNNGKCVNGKCVCSVGFSGPNCGTQVCPNNCSNRGRCMRGKCVCRHGFTGKDCSQCQEGMTGPDCEMAMSGVSQLRAQNITDTSVTLVWTPPSVQYETYYITFTSQKEGDQPITLQVQGHLTTFTQTGLAAGQKYSATIVGELKGRRGTESMTDFMTLISAPTNLRVVKTTSTTAVVEWEPSQGDIDRYRLTISPREGAGRTREMTVGPGENSAQIQQLEAGRMYDIILVAEKGLSRSQPATTQVVPGKTIPEMTRKALALQVPKAPGDDVKSMDQELNPSSKEQVFDQQSKTEDRDEAVSERDTSSSDPSLLYSSTVMARTKPLAGQILAGNITRPKDLARPTVLRPRFPNWFRYNGTRGVPGGRKVVSGHPIKPPEPARPGFASVKDKHGDKSLDPPIPDWRDTTNVSERQKLEEPTSLLGSNVQPQSATAELRNDTGVFQNQEKKCVNRMTVKHLRLPLKDTLNGCRENGEGLRENSKTTDLKSASLRTGINQNTTPDTLHQLIINTFDRMNITTISVHLSKPLNLSADAETVSKQIIGGMKPFSSMSSVSYLQPSSESVNTKSASQTHLPLSSSSQSSSPSLPLSPSSLPQSSSSSSSDEFDSTGSDEMSKTATAPVSSKNRQTPALKEGAFTPQRHMPHRWYKRHPPRNFRIPQKKTLQILKAPQDSKLNQTKEESLPPSSPPVEFDSLPRDKMINKSLTARLGSSGMEYMPTERRRFHVHRPPPRKVQSNQSFTRSPNQPSTSIRVSSSQEISNPKDPSPFDPEPSREDRKEFGMRKSAPNVSTAFNHTTRGTGFPLSRPPTFHHPQNITNMRLTLNRQPMPKTLPTNMPSSSRTITERQYSELGKYITPDNIPREQNLNTNGSQKTKPGEIETSENAQIERNSTNSREQTHKAAREDNAMIETEKMFKSAHEERANTGRGFGEKYKGVTSHLTNDSAKSVFDTESERRQDSAEEPLEFVRATNRTSDGFMLAWGAPEGKYEKFVVSSTEAEKTKESPSKKDNSTPEPKNELLVDGSNVGEVTKIPSSNGAKPPERTTVLPGSARLHQFKDLASQTEYTVTLLGMGPGLLSSLHKLVISTGPEPPTNIAFSKVTENSLTVSWTKPKSSVSGFKVTYTHADEGEPVSVTLDSADSSLALSRLSPGSTYEVTIISTLGLDESDPIRDSVMTLPDPPTDLRAINVTDSAALLLWRPAFAAVNKYAIVYGSGTGERWTLGTGFPAATHIGFYSPVRVVVSGNAAEQQLSALQESTTYTVTITSQLGSLESSAATTSFTTTSGRDADGPRDLLAKNVTPRTATLSWKPPSNPVKSYLLTYQTEGQDIKEVIVDASVTQFNLTRLHPGSRYSVELIAIRGQHRPSISTKFTTGTLRFPYPIDCTQELLNGIRTSGEVEIFPQGKLGTPMMVYCDMETDGGGWMVFQRRKDGSEDFYRGWKDYVKGFGDLNGEFWLGLEKIHNLSTMAKMMLRVDLQDGGESVFAKYSTFEVTKRNYMLKVEGYSGTAGDSMSYHNRQIFSTKDRYPSTSITSCPMSYRGGWWYKNCHEANLNGLYGFDFKHQGIIWSSWKGTNHSIQFTELKMRPTAFRLPARK